MSPRIIRIVLDHLTGRCKDCVNEFRRRHLIMVHLESSMKR